MHVYDKAKYHHESVRDLGLPEEHATHHTAFFFRWLVERGLTSDEFRAQGGGVLARFERGEASIYELYEWWDNCLLSDMLSAEGNAFAMAYFDFDAGQYLSDYASTLQGDLPSEFHVAYTEANYRALKTVLDQRYEEWRAGREGPASAPRVT